ncbi:MAG: hypothetical protein R3C61_10545 [Bacteroidia bacterium]
MNLGEYRFGFQNQETDPEIYGTGNAVSYKYRVEDARLGRFLSVDPLSPEYPWNSPYAFSENRVMDAVELEGAEPMDPVSLLQQIIWDVMSLWEQGKQSQRDWFKDAKPKFFLALNSDFDLVNGGIMFTSSKPYTGGEETKRSTGSHTEIVNLDMLLDLLAASKATADDAVQIANSWGKIQKAFAEVKASQVLVKERNIIGKEPFTGMILEFEDQVLRATKKLDLSKMSLSEHFAASKGMFDTFQILNSAGESLNSLPPEEGETRLDTFRIDTIWEYETPTGRTGRLIYRTRPAETKKSKPDDN